MKKNILKSGMIFGIFIITCTIISRGLYVFSIANVTLTQSKRYSIVHDLQKTARIEGNNEHVILSEPDQIVASISVKEGDYVKEGQILFSVDLSRLHEQLTKLKNEVQQLDHQISDYHNQVAERSNQEELALAHAYESYQNVENKWNEQLHQAQIEIDEAQWKYDEYVNQMDQGEEEASPDEEETISDIDKSEYSQDELEILETDIRNAQRQYDEYVRQRDSELLTGKQNIENNSLISSNTSTAEQLQLQKELINHDISKLTELLNNHGKVLSPKEGVITQLFIVVGSTTPSTACAIIADVTSGVSVKLQVDSEEIQYISKDCTVAIKGKSDRGDEIEIKNAMVSSIKELEESSSQQEEPKMYEVIITSAETVFTIGTTVLVNIQNESITYDTCIPTQALHQERGDEFYVFVISEKDTMLGKEKVAWKLPVKVLDKNMDFAALENNTLSNSQKIIYTSDRLVQEGNVVREK